MSSDILVYKTPYGNTVYIDATGDNCDKAHLVLFKTFDKCNFYNDLKKEKHESAQGKLYRRAKRGDMVAIYDLLNVRRDYEYEEFYIETIKSPEAFEKDEELIRW